MDFLEQLAAAGAVVLLLAMVLWWLRRSGLASLPLTRTRTRRLECLEKLPLGPQHTLHLVRLGDRELLLASTPGGCTVVDSPIAVSRCQENRA
jgi:flagellar biosynthetic protein FliO